MIDNYMIYKNLPTIDLHGMNRYEAISLINDFILNNLRLNNHLLLIVHGKGTGVLKNEVHKFLKSNSKVKAFKLDIFNDGVTIVEI